MKPHLSLLILLAGATSAPAANLMINFHTDGTGAVSGAENLTLSPAHDLGQVPSGETTWNNFNSTVASSSLLFSDGSAATGVSITFGAESSTLADTLDYSTTATINVTALDGTGGGTAGTTTLMSSPDSVYGNGTGASNTAPGRAGWLGNNSSGPNDGLGLRIDGLTTGDYRVYVMGRNTNSSTATPMDFFAASGTLAGTFDYTAVGAVTATNPQVPNTDPTGHDAFVNGVTYVAIDVSVGDGESLFLAADGASAGEVRGFLNMVQVVPVPEPSSGLLALGGALLLIRRRRA